MQTKFYWLWPSAAIAAVTIAISASVTRFACRYSCRSAYDDDDFVAVAIQQSFEAFKVFQSQQKRKLSSLIFYYI